VAELSKLYYTSNDSNLRAISTFHTFGEIDLAFTFTFQKKMDDKDISIFRPNPPSDSGFLPLGCIYEKMYTEMPKNAALVIKANSNSSSSNSASKNKPSCYIS